jgi:hypothetical protein
LRWILVLLMGVLLVSGCTQAGSDMYRQTHEMQTTTEEKAKLECVFLCESMKSKIDLSNGPCLSDDNPDWDVEDWVCDVAHSPREPVDNLPENQCQDYRERKATHFVEVDPDCNFIKAV